MLLPGCSRRSKSIIVPNVSRLGVEKVNLGLRSVPPSSRRNSLCMLDDPLTPFRVRIAVDPDNIFLVLPLSISFSRCSSFSANA